jgi:hypothetical protein
VVKSGSLYSFIVPVLACGISDRVAGQVIRDWTCREHQEYWHFIAGQKQTKCFLSKLSAKRTVKFLKLNRSQAQVRGLLTGCNHLEGNLFELGVIGSPVCGRCHVETEAVSHILCECVP